MNLANKLTMLRIFLIPVFLLFMLTPLGGGAGKWIALAVFLIASLTDLADGYIARRYRMITTFGKFMDPLADKLLVCSALVCLVQSGKLSALFAIIIISREFIISGFRLIAAQQGKVIAASYWGKWKTTFQMAMICLLIADLRVLSFVTAAVTWIAVILTVVSLVDYLMKNRSVLK